MPARSRGIVLATSDMTGRDTFVQRLASRGLSVWSAPVTRTVLRPSAVALLAHLIANGEFDWLIVTSRRTSEVIHRAPMPVAAVGPATAASLEARGIAVTLVGTGAGGRELGRLILSESPQRPLRCLWPRASGADRALAQLLRSGGATVREIALYETQMRPLRARLRLERALTLRQIRVVCFFAPSGVRSLVRQISPRSLSAIANTPVASFGVSTTAELRRHGLRPAIESITGQAAEFADQIAAATELSGERRSA
jgi:uroporphyrinogen-III synthase